MDDEYYVWSNQHRAWWRANSRGYAKDIAYAGKYTRDEAISICAHCRDGWGSSEIPDEIPVRVSDVEECHSIFEQSMVGITRSVTRTK